MVVQDAAGLSQDVQHVCYLINCLTSHVHVALLQNSERHNQYNIVPFCFAQLQFRQETRLRVSWQSSTHVR